MDKTVSPELTSANIPKVLMRYTLSTLCALLCYNLFSLTDALFISYKVGAQAVGAISVAFPFTIFQGAVSTALGGGAASLVARKLGAGDRVSAGNIAVNAMAGFWITALAVTALGLLFLNPMLHALGVTEELFADTKSYLTILLLGNLFSTGFSSIIRAEGNMKYGMLIWVIPISLNILLDALFILALDWGVKGGALGTVIGQFASFSMCILFFTRYSKLSYRQVKLRIKTMLSVFNVGLPALVSQMTLSLTLMLLNNMLKQVGGTEAITVYAYVNKIVIFALVPIQAIVQALSPMAGTCYGKKEFHKARLVLKWSLIYTTGYGFLATGGLLLFAEGLLRVLTKEQFVLTNGAQVLHILAGAVAFFAVPVVTGAYFLSAGKLLRSHVVNVSFLAVFIPVLFLFSQKFGLNGVWWSFTAASVLAAVLTACIALSGKKRICPVYNKSAL